MRRTYRSKKDTTSVIDRRDLFQNLDDKSSAYDAFSIQNIKQTKREFSCVGSSNPLGVASSRARKKKFVKRIVKEAELTRRENTSESTYLTPDRSIRVNKPLDAFDLLLMSSPARPIETTVKDVESVTSKMHLFDRVLPQKEGRAYTRRKPKKVKKCNYSSSDNSDSDKENSDGRPNITGDTSDIRTHKLLVEKVINTTPKIKDDSINNIVNNISLLNKLKHNCSANDSTNRSLILNRHRLTRNILSPLSQKSPLSSTPFKAKYRGQSIFTISPITSRNRASSLKQVEPFTEEKDDSNCSVVPLNNVKVDSPKESEEKVLNLSLNYTVMEEASNEILFTEKDVSVETKPLSVSNLFTNTNYNETIEITSLQNTEIEPFLGFSNYDNREIIPGPIIELPDIDDLSKNTSKTDLMDSSEDNDNSEKVPEYEIKLPDIDLAEDTIKSDIMDSTEDENDFPLEEKKYGNYTVLDCARGIDVAENSHCHDDSFSELSSANSTNDDDKGSLYDTCTSEQSSILEQRVKKEPLVVLQRMNDSSFFKYYNKIKNDYTDNSYDDSSIHSEFASFEDCTDCTDLKNTSSSSSIESSLDCVLENKTEYNNIKMDTNDDEEISSNNEEKCISFVTTRRRNDLPNKSMISMYNESYQSSSPDCDNTVLSSYKGLMKHDVNNSLDDSDIEINDKLSINDPEIIDLNKDSENSDEAAVETETKISFVTTRNSNITDRKSSIRPRRSSYKQSMSTVSYEREKLLRQSIREESRMSCFDGKHAIVLQPGKKWERSLSIYRRMTMMADHFDKSILEDESGDSKGRKYRQSVISTMEMQEFNGSLHNESISSRRSTFVSKPSRSTIRIVKDTYSSRLSLCNSTLEDLQGFLNEECDDTIIEFSKLSITDQTHEVTVLDNFHDTSNRIATAKDYVLRRCDQTEPIQFDECYPDSLLKNCHKIGEGVYGEVYLWRDRDGRARVLKIVPIAGSIKVNGESQKDFHEIISEIVIAMELSALRAPIADIERHFDEEKDVETLDLLAIENATDVFNEVLAVRCVYGSYPSRLLDLWDLYDECKGSENDNPAILPVDQQYIVLELANAGQDLESFQFNNAEQAHALFLQVAYGLAVAEEAFQFEHRDLHWGNVLIAPTEQKYATFVIRGRLYRTARCGVAATVIDYSLSRCALRLGADSAALYNDLAADESLFDAVGDYQFQVYRLMRDKLGNDWKNYEPYTNILWLHYTVDKMITALRYKRPNTKIHKHHIDKLKGIKGRILDYGSAAQYVLTDNEI